jgi:tRNA-Thr(GGU) m(6)t(6)A37 methyltransferase TsaA
MEFRQIGTIYSEFKEASGTPIQPGAAKEAKGRIIVFEEFAEGLSDLEGFERIWIIYHFDRSCEHKLKVKPYLDDVERGLFATRAPCRPNPIGMSCVKLLSIERNVLQIEDVDILDGTPLLDIKPYAPKFDHFDIRRSGWLDKVKLKNKKADDRFEE